MERGVLNDREAFDCEVIEMSEIKTSEEDVLARKTPAERIKYLRRHFHQTEQPIQDIKQPPLCQRYPNFTEEIEAAYLQYTTFTAKVIVNYDGACKQFFMDDRVRDCGKLFLSSKDKKRVEKYNPKMQMTRIHFAIGTAFRTFSYAVLRAKQDGEVSAINKPETGDHPLLMSFVNDMCGMISGFTLTGGQTGFTLENVEEIAGCFLRPKDDKTYLPYPKTWRTPDEWMSTGRGFGSNPGNIEYLRY